MSTESVQNVAGRGELMEEEMEEEMEQFFAIIRRIRAARSVIDRSRARADRPEEGEEERGGTKKRMRSGTKSGGSWIPKFEWEDFNTEVEFPGSRSSSTSSAPAGNGGNEEEKEKEKNKKKKKIGEDESKSKLPGDRLDLTLTL